MQEIGNTTVKDIINLLRLKKQNKDRIIRYIRNLFKHEEEED